MKEPENKMEATERKLNTWKKNKFLHCYSYKYIVTYTKQFYDFNEKKKDICCNLEDLLIN